jgi:hypothetical protein
MKETLALLKFGRESAWSLSITLPGALTDEIALSITYDVDWEGCDGSTDWAMAKFFAAANADGVVKPPIFDRPDIKWEPEITKENNAFHILIRQTLVNGARPSISEDPGLPVMIIYGPNAIIKLRRQTPDRSQILPSLSTAHSDLSGPSRGRRAASHARIGHGRISWKRRVDRHHSSLPPLCLQSMPMTCESMKHG